MSRATLAALHAERNRCPECGRKSAVSTVLNPGTASRVCRWCGWESTTVLYQEDDSTLRRMSKPVMVMRSLRVQLRLWEQAKAKADEREENLSDVIREALERYVKRK